MRNKKEHKLEIRGLTKKQVARMLMQMEQFDWIAPPSKALSKKS